MPPAGKHEPFSLPDQNQPGTRNKEPGTRTPLLLPEQLTSVRGTMPNILYISGLINQKTTL